MSDLPTAHGQYKQRVVGVLDAMLEASLKRQGQARLSTAAGDMDIIAHIVTNDRLKVGTGMTGTATYNMNQAGANLRLPSNWLKTLTRKLDKLDEAEAGQAIVGMIVSGSSSVVVSVQTATPLASYPVAPDRPTATLSGARSPAAAAASVATPPQA